MKITIFLMNFLLVLGVIQLNAQINPFGGDWNGVKKGCVSFTNIQQECMDNGTVTLTFQIANDSNCKASGITIKRKKSLFYPFPLPSQTVSASSISLMGFTPGVKACFEVKLHGDEGQICCTKTICIDVKCCDDSGCCDVSDLNAEILNLPCGPDERITVEVTGGNPPYSGPAPQLIGSPGTFVFTGLDSGVHDLEFTDSNGCSVEVSVAVPEESLSIGFLLPINTTCSDGALQLSIIGGVPPYIGRSNQMSNVGNFNYQHIPPGDYAWSFFDSNGCEIIVEFRIELINNCGQFRFTRDQGDNTGNNIYAETFISQATANITVELNAFTVPDQVIVTVNGDVVSNFSAGNDSCDNNDFPPGQGPTAGIEMDIFCVKNCDVVNFTVLGDVCPIGSTAWDLTVTCEEKEGDSTLSTPNDDILSLRNNSDIGQDGYYIEAIMNSKQLVELYPNPVSNMLNVTKIDPLFSFKTVRIMNSAGSVIHSESMSGKNQIQIDASAFPKGVYILECEDDYGHRTVEKFLKVK